jgi:hypothetical protein
MVLISSFHVCIILTLKTRALDDLWQCNYMSHKPQKKYDATEHPQNEQMPLNPVLVHPQHNM